MIQAVLLLLIIEISSEPVSRVMYHFRDDDDLSRPYVAARLERSTWRQTGQACGLLFDLAPDGACTAIFVTKDAVVSYTAVSPLPQIIAVYSLLRFPAGHPGRTLSVILPCGARTFLDMTDTRHAAIIRLTY